MSTLPPVKLPADLPQAPAATDFDEDAPTAVSADRQQPVADMARDFDEGGELDDGEGNIDFDGDEGAVTGEHRIVGIDDGDGHGEAANDESDPTLD